MKIHIVQKGDTLWEISKKYGVDFEELKGMNTQLSSPDMIMPGMKIKVPGSTKAVKKETVAIKETKKEAVQPYKDTSPKPIAAIEEDDYQIQKPVKPEMPVPAMPQMPIMEQDINQYMTINFPQMPQMKAPQVKPEKKEAKKEEVKQQKPIQKPMQKPVQQPMQKPMQQPMQKPVQQPMQKPMQQPMQPIHQPPVYQPIHHQPMQPPFPHAVPVCWHFHPPCCQPSSYHQFPMPFDGQMEPAFQPPAQVAPMSDCGCNGSQLVPYPNQQMEPSMENMPNAYPSHQSTPGMYPPQFGTMPEDGDFYPKPPSFPNFSALRKEKENQQDE
ncbi:SafA/ExsA family spore coat assembly protein [Oceanobacillus sp. CF4.6]|uniref:SafA/ExsA family spore coat assembly protein n=1 Tax=Oceanobacillus sp. CF4.6 TaxID=3373080 RepID=UPI003EE6D06C